MAGICARRFRRVMHLSWYCDDRSYSHNPITLECHTIGDSPRANFDDNPYTTPVVLEYRSASSLSNCDTEHHRNADPHCDRDLNGTNTHPHCDSDVDSG